MLRHELESRGVQTVSHIAPTAHTAPPGQPPQVGHGPSNLFSGIMANANQGGSGPGLAPPPPQDQQPPPHALQQPVAAAQPGQPLQSSFGGYPPGAAVTGM
jgi:glucose repression regulatory protein TUP1